MSIIRILYHNCIFGVISICNIILYIIYPPRCLVCRLSMHTRQSLCKQCKLSIMPIVSGVLHIKNMSIPVFAVSEYKDPIRQLILAKHRSDRAASYCLADLMWQMTYLHERAIDYFIPVPLHWTRYAWRGFNQSHEIARGLAAKSGKSIACIVKRSKKTTFQAALSVEDRVKNVASAFSLSTKNKDQYQGKHLVVVDDLMTTGSTLQAVCKELIKVKPASITVVVAARVIGN